jgi:hypothetical protein
MPDTAAGHVETLLGFPLDVFEPALRQWFVNRIFQGRDFAARVVPADSTGEDR